MLILLACLACCTINTSFTGTPPLRESLDVATVTDLHQYMRSGVFDLPSLRKKRQDKNYMNVGVSWNNGEG